MPIKPRSQETFSPSSTNVEFKAGLRPADRGLCTVQAPRVISQTT